MHDLWETGLSDFKGEYFQMDDCVLSPRPKQPIQLVAAGQSDRGMEFAAQYCDYNFALGEGVNEPTKAAGVPARMLEHAAKTGRDVGSLHALHDHRRRDRRGRAWPSGTPTTRAPTSEALAHLLGKAAEDTAPSETSMAAAILRAPSPINFNMGTLVGSPTPMSRACWTRWRRCRA